MIILPFPCQMQELVDRSNIHWECPEAPASFGFAPRIPKPNFTSTCVTISRRTSSNVHKRFVLSIKCFSTSPNASASRPAKLDFTVQCHSLVSRGTTRKIPFFETSLKIQQRASSRKCSFFFDGVRTEKISAVGR